MLEEPPARSLFLLVSHAPGRLLPTIRSRCRRLTLAPLSTADVVAAATAALGPDADTGTLATAAEASGGSVARALALAGGPQLALRREVEAMLAALPSTDPNALHALGDQLDRDRACSKLSSTPCATSCGAASTPKSPAPRPTRRAS